MKPKIRPINAFPVEANGRKLICLQDPMKISDKTVLIDYQTYFIVSMMDGKNEISDIQLAYTRQFGEILLNNQINSLLKDLDNNLFLEGDKYNDAINRLKRSFSAQPIRTAVHAGTAYEEEPEKLHAQIQNILSEKGKNHYEKIEGKKLKALIAPHIDISAGENGYAHSYSRFLKDDKADLYVILGVTHAASQNEYVLTSKDFETPIGISATERDFIRVLEETLPHGVSDDEFIHKSEHSIEFQLIFIQHILGNANYKIVPILCGGFHMQLDKGKAPEENKTTEKFLNTLRNEIDNYDGSVCIIAGVDLSHVGTKFGSASPITHERLPAIERLDKEMLEHVVKCDKRGFYKNIEMDKNGRNVCGFGAIYTLLYLLGDSTGKLLHYGQNYQSETSSAVTFASIAFY